MEQHFVEEPCQEGWHRPVLSLFAKVFTVFSCKLPKVACFQKFAFAKRSGAMKAPVGLLSDRTVLRSKMEGPRPDKFAFSVKLERVVDGCRPVKGCIRKWIYRSANGQPELSAAEEVNAKNMKVFMNKLLSCH